MVHKVNLMAARPSSWAELLWDAVLLAVVTGHLLASPYTKVEESWVSRRGP